MSEQDTITFDTLIIGAGAAGLMCAATAARRGLSVVVLDHAKQAGKKILISGGGRCNFTNMYTSPENFLSENPHFCKSALSRYTQWDFVAMVDKHKIPWHEKTLGQLFCDDSAKDIVRMLMQECRDAGAKVELRTEIFAVDAQRSGYSVKTAQAEYHCKNLVVACGGLSMPKLGATPFGYKLAEQFGHSIVPVRAGLVPFTLHDTDKQAFADLSGVASDVVASNEKASFREAMLFTHRGLSGPAMLQISSFWQPGETVAVNLLPNEEVLTLLQTAKVEQPRSGLVSVLSKYLPKRLVQVLANYGKWPTKKLADISNVDIERVANNLAAWPIKPNGTEGYRTAEVTIGGVNVNEVSSKTMESKLQPGLFFIGEVLDVTGWLGGYNFQWAWSSGWVCGESVN
ncbi:aminoacetone oxidase family FAD-binding enzyme [Aliidiomarina iranensis]|uniref:Aminoacetone oxidase family FAD-binding enzyme n=1 Tax=Aliidiomarina iranensis TaxID=1434071 RepID=A0A432VR25_9GAMM|nr:NAD(P)/FAD-dependent oxidoreductase [Aliidiomarina iranensis]RUO18724.1 aminoacetone oxidase family FAD-binding enzyme [Aliidiomarina iranensis]